MHRFFGTEMGFHKLYHFTDESLPITQDFGPDQDSRPTGSTLRRFLRTRFTEPFLRDGDNLWFFFAGHGVRYKGRDYLMPIDADPEDLDNSAIPIQYISQRLRRSGADNIILLIDACRSYEGRRDGIGIGKEKQQGVITLFSCSPEESSYEIKELQQGAFTHTLLDSLRLQGEGNCATVERLYQRLRYYVPQLTRQYKQTVQTPYGVIEPLSKSHLILLPGQATLSDVGTLKKDALTAEVQRKTKKARQLWIRVLAVSPADPEAIEGIERLLGGWSQSTTVAETLPIKRGTDPVPLSPKQSLKIPVDDASRISEKSEQSLPQKQMSKSTVSPVSSLSVEKSPLEQNFDPAHPQSMLDIRMLGIKLRLAIPVIGIIGSCVGLFTALIPVFRSSLSDPTISPTPQPSEIPKEALSADQDEPSPLTLSDPSAGIDFSRIPCSTISDRNSGFNSDSLSVMSSSSLPKGELVLFEHTSLARLSDTHTQSALMAQGGLSFPTPDSVRQGTEIVIYSSSDNMNCISNALKQAFESEFVETQVKIKTGADSFAVQNVLDGDADLAAISRPLTEEEKSKGLIAVPVRREKIAIVVDKNNPNAQSLISITGSQFAQIFRGEIRDWAAIGGTAGPIKVVDRPATSATRQSLKPYPVFTTASFEAAPGSTILKSDTTEALVKTLGTDGIGYVLVGQLESQPELKAIQLHKTPPTDPRYPFSQPYSYVYAGSASPAVSAFLGYATSNPGQAAINDIDTSGYSILPGGIP